MERLSRSPGRLARDSFLASFSSLQLKSKCSDVSGLSTSTLVIRGIPTFRKVGFEVSMAKRELVEGTS
jgi:hypothetical protein